MTAASSPLDSQILAILADGQPRSRATIASRLPTPASQRSVTRYLANMVANGQLVRTGKGNGQQYQLPTASQSQPQGDMPANDGEPASQSVPPAKSASPAGGQAWWRGLLTSNPGIKSDQLVNVSLSVRNPLDGILVWLRKLLNGDAIAFTVRIKVVYALLLLLTVAIGASASYRMVYDLGQRVGLARVGVYDYLPDPNASPTPVPTANPWRQTAFTGLVQYSWQIQQYFLFTADGEAIQLVVPTSIDLQPLIGRRIFAAGNYHDGLKVLEVVEASGLEVLPQAAEPVPTVVPTPAVFFQQPEATQSGEY